ncbi:MAG: alpha/beta fold hydrolase [Promethearchaeota archaeon]
MVYQFLNDFKLLIFQRQKGSLILQGKCDLLVPPQNGEILAGLIPGSKLKIFENCGHALYVDQTEVFMSTIIDFFD